jgi:hypothetical protein
MTENDSQNKCLNGFMGGFLHPLWQKKYILLLVMAISAFPWLTSRVVWGQTPVVMDPEQMAVIMDTLEEKDLRQALSGLMQYPVETLGMMYESKDSIDPEQAGNLNVGADPETYPLLHWPIDPEQAQEIINK